MIFCVEIISFLLKKFSTRNKLKIFYINLIKITFRLDDIVDVFNNINWSNFEVGSNRLIGGQENNFAIILNRTVVDEKFVTKINLAQYI